MFSLLCVKLSAVSQLLLAPAMSTPEAVFKELQDRFDYDEAIAKEILATGVTSLSEFRFYSSNEEDVVKTFVTPITELDKPRLQAARVKRAWSSIAQAEKAGDASQVEGVPLEEDECLPASTLSSMKEVFWKRYHWLPPPEQQPSDKLLSKLSRALQKKNLEVMNMFQVRTLANQRVATSKRRKVAPMFWVGEPADEEQAVQEDCASYLECLFVYMVALAMAGAGPILPAPTEAESIATLSHDYVEFPLGLAWKYHFRAVEASKEIGERMKLPHISSLDLNERAVWCQKYSTGTEKLGAIVYRIFMERDVHRSAVAIYPQGASASGPPPEPAGTPPAARGGDKKAGKLSTTFRDGTKLCGSWQHGRCDRQREARCPNGEHRCAHKLKSGRICGDPYHTGSRCNNKQKL